VTAGPSFISEIALNTPKTYAILCTLGIAGLRVFTCRRSHPPCPQAGQKMQKAGTVLYQHRPSVKGITMKTILYMYRARRSVFIL